MPHTNDVFAIVGAKGGIGKTTTSLYLAAALAAEGYSTVAVELDIGMANFADFLDVDIDVSEIVTLHDVLADKAAVESACYRVTDRFSIAISGITLASYAETALSRLPDIVEKLRWHFDVVLLDTPAGVNEEVVSALQVADQGVLVSTPRVASIRNAKNTLDLADSVDTDVHGLVLTKSGTGASPGADRIADFLGVDLLGHVPEDDAVVHSQDRGEPVIDYAPQSGAAIAYRMIAGNVVDDDPTETDHATLESPSDSCDSSGVEAVAEDHRRNVVAHADELQHWEDFGTTTDEWGNFDTPNDPSYTPTRDVETASPGTSEESRTQPSDSSSSSSTTTATSESRDSRGRSTNGPENDDPESVDPKSSERATTEQVQPDKNEPVASDGVEDERSAVETDDDTMDAVKETDETSVRDYVRSFLGL